MKKNVPFLLLFIFIGIQLKVDAQTSSINKDSIEYALSIQGANNLKTGNWQDVLSNFFQLGVSDIIGPNKSFNFKSSLFGIKLKTNPSLNVDTEYLRHSFDRNFQFNFSLSVDSQYRVNGFSGGFTWAVVNKRDLTLINLVNTKIDSIWETGYNELDEAIYKYQWGKYRLRTSKDSIEGKTLGVVIDKMMANGKLCIDSLPKDFAVDPNVVASINTLNKIYTAYDSVKQNTAQEPLLTLSFNSVFNKQSKFDSAQFGGIFLQGLTKTGKTLELDLRADINIKDTLIGRNQYRTVFNSSGGLNYSLLSNNKTGASIFEIKPYIEYDKIFSPLLPGENPDNLYANVDLRLRITSTLWIPLTLKYDCKKGNFLGFLNVAINM